MLDRRRLPACMSGAGARPWLELAPVMEMRLAAAFKAGFVPGRQYAISSLVLLPVINGRHVHSGVMAWERRGSEAGDMSMRSEPSDTPLGLRALPGT